MGAEKASRDEIIEGIKTKGWIMYTSDKSSKLVLYAKENFLSWMKEHYHQDQIVTTDEVSDGEGILMIIIEPRAKYEI